MPSNYYQPNWNPQAPPPAWQQYGPEVETAEAREAVALARALALNRFQTETMPDLRNRAASRGQTFSGAPSRAITRAAQHIFDESGGIKEFDLQKLLLGLTTNQALLTTGTPIPGGMMS